MSEASSISFISDSEEEQRPGPGPAAPLPTSTRVDGAVSLWDEVRSWGAAGGMAAGRCSSPDQRLVSCSGLGLMMQVDIEDLERRALGIARNAVPPAEDRAAEVAARTLSAGPVEWNSHDPLGLGRVDMRTLELVSYSRGPDGLEKL